MKIFGWMQNKLTGRHQNQKSNLIHFDHHVKLETWMKFEEFSDRHHGLLTIGTFGNNSVNEEADKANLQENPPPSPDHLHDDLTPEEVGKLQNELNLILGPNSEEAEPESENTNHFLGKVFSGRHSSLETEEQRESDKKSSCHQGSNSVVLCRGKDISLDNTKKAIGKKSLSFLLKKMLVCRSGFAPAPSLRDPNPESRMEKILWAILQKKIYPQSPNPKLSVKKYLESNLDGKTEKVDDGSKWVKTDSEYIVLEI